MVKHISGYKSRQGEVYKQRTQSIKKSLGAGELSAHRRFPSEMRSVRPPIHKVEMLWFSGACKLGRSFARFSIFMATGSSTCRKSKLMALNRNQRWLSHPYPNAHAPHNIGPWSFGSTAGRLSRGQASRALIHITNKENKNLDTCWR